MPLTRLLEIARYRTTKEVNEKLSKLSHVSGWPDHIISRLAISRSLIEADAPAVVAADRKGKELRGETLFHSKQDPDYLPWITAMIAQHLGRPFADEDEAIELVLSHLHRGIELLFAEFEHVGDFLKIILGLARRVGDNTNQRIQLSMPSRVGFSTIAGVIRPIEIQVGTLARNGEAINVVMNDTRKHSNCHFALCGMSGSGKTQLALQILASAASFCDSSTGIFFIDYAKGDVASDVKFAKALAADVIRLPGQHLPVAPFHLYDYSPELIKLAAEEKREVYKNLFRLGPKQQGRLANVIRESYEDLSTNKEVVPDFDYISDQLEQVYQRESQQPDTLTETFRQLTAVKLFWSRGDVSPPLPLHTNRWIVDVHELAGLKEIVAFTLIEQLYREMRNLPDSEVDSQTGLRHIRCIIAIDEAQNYLKAQNRFLQGIIREGRSKGFAVMLMCQSPSDFDQSDFDYTEQMLFTYMLKCKTEVKAVQRLLGVTADEAKRISNELSKAENLFGFGRTSESKVEKFRLTPFYEAYAT
jgi:DNA sulfur modification protein DndE